MGPFSVRTYIADVRNIYIFTGGPIADFQWSCHDNNESIKPSALHQVQRGEKVIM